MLSVRVAGGEAAAIATAANVAVFGRATSLGGTESLIEHRSSVEGPSTPVPADLLRLSIGLEHPDDLIADLEAALHAGATVPGATTVQGAPAAGGERSGAAPEGDRAMVIARGGDLTDLGPVGSPGAWHRLGYRRTIEPVLPPDAEPTTLLQRIETLLATEISPSVAAHGDSIEVDGIDTVGTVRLSLHGGCQGCALAEVTVYQGVAPILRGIDGVRAVVDVTDHLVGAAPYFKPAKR